MKKTCTFLYFILLLLLGISFGYAQTQKDLLEHTQKNFFIENKGQWPGEVKFLAKVNGLNAWITKSGITYDFYKIENCGNLPKVDNHRKGIKGFPKDSSTITGHVVKMSLMNQTELSGNQFIGIDKQEGYNNYFIGNDSTKWASFVPLYYEVLVKNPVSGINTRYYFENGKIRYDYIIEPGKNPAEIALICDLGIEDCVIPANAGIPLTVSKEIPAYAGMTSQYQKEIPAYAGMTCNFSKKYSKFINENGELVLNTSLGEIIQGKIIAYQEINGQKIEIPCRFKINDDESIAFNVDKYNNDFPLIIDPLVYSTYLGGAGAEWCCNFKMDKDENIYITGVTSSSNFPVTTGAYQMIYGGDQSYTHYEFMGDVYVTKLDPNAYSRIFSTYIGGKGDEMARDMALDKDCNIYLTGRVRSTDFPITTGAFQTYNKGGRHYEEDDGFVLKLNSSGSSLIFSTFIGGGDDEYTTGIAIDSNCEVYITGFTLSDDYPSTPGAFQETYPGHKGPVWENCWAIFITKFNKNATNLRYSTFIGDGYSSFESYGIVVDENGCAYITGTTDANNYPITPGAYQTSRNGATNIGSRDAIVTKLNQDGSGLVFSTYIGGNHTEESYSIKLDKDKNVFITGVTNSDDFPASPGAYQTTKMDTNTTTTYIGDSFVTKFNPDCSKVIYSTYIGGYLEDYALDIAIDDSANAYITGYTNSLNFPTTKFAYQKNMAGDHDVFITKLNPSGTAIDYSSYLGGNAYEYPISILLDKYNNVIIAGTTSSTDFPVTKRAFQPKNAGGGDVFVTKLGIVPIDSIITGTDIKSICAGSEFDLPFTILGQFNPGNVFITQLSDKNGDFSSPVNVGSKAGTTSDTIHVTIPKYTLYGTKYRVRVVSSDPPLIGKPDTIDITINPQPEPVIIGPDGYCKGDSIVLKVKEKYSSYKWNTGETTDSIYINNSSNYFVTVTDSNGCEGQSPLKEISEYPKPAVVITGPDTVCLNSIVTYNFQGDSWYFYLLVLGSYISTDYKNFLTVKWIYPGTGRIIYQAHDLSTGCFGDELIFIVHIIDDKKPTLNISGGVICNNDSILISSNEDFDDYLWNNGETTNSIYVKNSGKYYLIANNNTQCPVYSDTISIIQDPKPDVSIIGDSVICDDNPVNLSSNRDFQSYKWSTGESSKSIIVNNEGKYTLSVTDSNGCTGIASIDIKKYDIILNGQTDLDFGRITFGKDSTGYQTITNNSNSDVVISRIYAKNEPSVFNILTYPSLPIKLMKSEFLNLIVIFKPLQLIDYSDSLIIETSEPCKKIFNSLLNGTSICSSFIWLPDTNAKIGDNNFCIPLMAKLNDSVKINDVISFSAEIRFDIKALMPVNISNSVESGERVVKLFGNNIQFTSNEIELGNFCNDVFLPDSDKIILKLTKFEWNNQNIVNETKNGSVTIKGLCQRGITRIQLLPVTNMSVTPNPANDEIILNIKSEEESNISVKIYTLQGIETFSINWENNGKTEKNIKLNLSDYSSGLYYIVLKSSMYVDMKQVRVIK